MEQTCNYCGGMKVHKGTCGSCGATVHAAKRDAVEPIGQVRGRSRWWIIGGAIAMGLSLSASLWPDDHLGEAFRAIQTREEEALQQNVAELTTFIHQTESTRDEVLRLRALLAPERERRVRALDASLGQARSLQDSFRTQLQAQGRS